MKIYVDVIGQKLKIVSSTKNLVSGSQNFIKFVFNFDSSWDGLSIFAQFQQDGNTYNQILDGENSAYLPAEITGGKVLLSLYGTGGTVVATVNYLVFTVDRNIIVEDAQSTQISTSLYQQLVNHVNDEINGMDGRLDYIEAAFVTPEMFGAVGDGVTDDTTSIQTALDHQGLIIFNPKKTYYVGSVLHIKANTTIDLQGATIRAANRHFLLNFTAADTSTGYSGNGSITVRNGTIYGGAVSFWHGKNILFENMNFIDGQNDHWLEICACKFFTIRRCRFIGMKNADSTLEYINIDPCPDERSYVFTGTQYPAGNYDGTRNEDITISDCYFNINENNSTFGHMHNAIGCHSPMGQYHKNIVIRNNRILNFSQTALRLSDMEGALVEGNTIYSTSNSGYGIVMEKNENMTYSNKGCIIQNNYLSPYKWGINVKYTEKIIIKNNDYIPNDGVDHTIISFNEGNAGATIIGNRKLRSSGTRLVAFDGNYSNTTVSPFIALQETSVSERTVSGSTVTLTKNQWRHFTKIGFRFQGSNIVYWTSAFGGERFIETAENNQQSYKLIEDYSGTNLVTFSISSDEPNKLTVTFASGSRNIASIYVASDYGEIN